MASVGADRSPLLLGGRREVEQEADATRALVHSCFEAAGVKAKFEPRRARSGVATFLVQMTSARSIVVMAPGRPRPGADGPEGP
jgi:hypothetical protein